jgi:phosphoribosylformylglycinamidine synthase
MTLAVPKNKWATFKKLMQKHGSEATVIGKFTASGICKVLFGKKTVMEIEMDFMHHGNPKHLQRSKKVQKKTSAHSQSLVRGYEKKLSAVLLGILKEANIGSTEFISTQYDHEVQGVSVTKPLHGKGRVNASASISRPNADTNRGIVLSQGLCPRYSDIDTYHMAASAIDQAIRNTVAIGGDPEYMALLDNFCWTSSHDPERLYELKRAAQACYDYALLYSAPFISGKDSMFNDFKGFDVNGNPLHVSVPPTLLISSISVTPDITHSVTLDLKKPGDLLYILGETKAEMGGSEFAAYLNIKSGTDHTGLHVPQVDGKKNATLYKRYYKAVQNGLVASAVGLDRGGFAIALLRSAIGGQLGIEVDVRKIGSSELATSEILFSESNGRLLVSVTPEKQKKFERMLKGSACACVGRVTSDSKIRLARGKRILAFLSVKDATDAYRFKFKNY